MQREQLIRNSCKEFFTSQIYTHSRNESLNNSKQKLSGRKDSSSKISNFLNIDKLIEDVKITQIKHNKYSVHIENIMAQLQALKGLPIVKDQIFTIELLLDTINKKLSSDYLDYSRTKNVHSSSKKTTPRQYTHRHSDNSPPKDNQDGSSIFYAKFSLKQMGSLSSQSSTMLNNAASSLHTPKKSSFHEQTTNRIMKKLNEQILVLKKGLKSQTQERVLQPHNIPKKAEFDHKIVIEASKTLSNHNQPEKPCLSSRRGNAQNYKWKNSKNSVECSRESKVTLVQPKCR